MADRIKKIKIKQADGTFSDYIPIGAEATNVDLKSGYTVEKAIGDLDIDTAGNITSQLSKATKFYDSVAAMKADNHLTGGAAAVTLGYYKPNDGGSGLYNIVKDDSLVEDGGSVHNLENGLKAQLIISNSINVKQFGAKGDGVSDDTAAIQKAIDCLFNKIKSFEKDSYLNNLTITMTEGKYLITDTIDFPVLLKLHIIGAVCLLVGKDNITGLWLNSRNFTNEIGSERLKNSITGTIIGSSVGALTIKKLKSDYSFHLTNCTSIGLEIGDRKIPESDNGFLSFCRSSIKNINIEHFENGLVINPINVYIANFENIRIEENNQGVLWGLNQKSESTNAGEKISFTNCLFAATHRVFIINKAITSVSFYNCSFDFNGNIIFVNNNFSNQINFFGGHIEQVGMNAWADDTKAIEGFGYIIYRKRGGATERTTALLEGICFVISSTQDQTGGSPVSVKYKFGTDDTTASFWSPKYTLAVQLKSWQIVAPVPIDENTFFRTDNIFLGDFNTSISYETGHQNNLESFFSSAASDEYGTFNKYEKGDLSDENLTFIGNNGTPVVYDASDAINIKPYFNKAIKITKKSSDTTFLKISKHISSIKGKYLKLCSIFNYANNDNYNKKIYYVISFRDKNNKEIASSVALDNAKGIISNDNDNWQAYIHSVLVPSSCESIIATLYIGYENNVQWSNDVYLGGFLIEYYN